MQHMRAEMVSTIIPTAPTTERKLQKASKPAGAAQDTRNQHDANGSAPSSHLMKPRRTVRTDRRHYDQNAPGVAPRSHLVRGRSIPHRPHTADPGPTPLEAARTLLGRREELPAKLSRTTIPKPFLQRPKAFVIQRSANQPRARGFPCPKESPAPVTVVKKVRLATNVAIHSQQWKNKEVAEQR